MNPGKKHRIFHGTFRGNTRNQTTVAVKLRYFHFFRGQKKLATFKYFQSIFSKRVQYTPQKRYSGFSRQKGHTVPCEETEILPRRRIPPTAAPQSTADPCFPCCCPPSPSCWDAWASSPGKKASETHELDTGSDGHMRFAYV